MQAMKSIGAGMMALLLGLMVLTSQVQAADKAKLEEFLEVTGFDVALDSIRLSAENAPQMLGLDAQDFGFHWGRMTTDVFGADLMHDMAIEFLGETLDEEHLDHAAGFYATDLGKRLVAVENKSHMSDDDDLKSESGEAIIAGLVRIGSPRVQILKRMNAASDSAGNGLRAIQEVQVRFLMAAAGAGIIELQMDEPDLRELLRTGEDELRLSMQTSGLASAAYVYQAFSDAEMEDYTAALEHPMIRHVYDLMNAVQFEIMADRFEALAARMKGVQPSEEL
ncbi:MAG: DUF2059 domain-containing protein [Ascidiaceihabitans sp.]|nr:DUF2059 domain-containing protein [Ascidiaceihabitans sp.]